MPVEVRGQPAKSVFSFHHVGPGTELRSSGLYLLSHLTGIPPYFRRQGLSVNLEFHQFCWAQGCSNSARITGALFGLVCFFNTRVEIQLRFS